ncbi:MAG: DUF2835 family protein [Gammaproteobacteria bacterium]|nr:DUF2835 family protein [Gammaproteobacteria bacterium]
MKESRFRLNFSANDLMKYYHGLATQVVTTTDNGYSIQFPARALRAYVDKNGAVKGYFRILYTDDNKFIRIDKII